MRYINSYNTSVIRLLRVFAVESKSPETHNINSYENIILIRLIAIENHANNIDDDKTTKFKVF